MSDAPARHRDLGSRWDTAHPVVAIIVGAVALNVLIATITQGSDWLAALIAVFLLATLKPWRHQ
jgi:hypothetical protein